MPLRAVVALAVLASVFVCLSMAPPGVVSAAASTGPSLDSRSLPLVPCAVPPNARSLPLNARSQSPDSRGLPLNARSLPPNGAIGWWLIYRGAHCRPAIPDQAASLLHRFSGVWAGDRRRRIVYLTFDAGEEKGNTIRIIGILARAHVRASFFLTGAYMRSHPVLTRRLVAHGHLVCNHSDRHISTVALARRPAAFVRDLRAAERAFRAATGGELAPFFRPPYGTYSARSLYLTERLGYTTVFWSFARVDWEPNDQPPPSVTVARILTASHPGAIYLLHSASPSNTNALARAIRGLKSQGYRFATLDELPW